MTIDELYRFIQLVANKEQRGFIKPSEFNLLAQQAQLDLIHDRVARYQTEAEKNKFASMALVQNHSVLDDIRSVVMEKEIEYDSDLEVYLYPENEIDEVEKAPMGEYLHFLSLYKTSRDNLIELVTHDQLSRRMNSQVNPISPDQTPSSAYVAVMHDKGFRIFINNIGGQLTAGNTFLVYIGKPVAPHWAYTIINNQYVHNPSSANTKNLTLPTKTHREIAQRMLSYIGISLRDQEPMVYAEAKVKDQSMTKR